MGDFVTGNRPLPARKVDARPPIAPEKEIDAADVNNLWDALDDVRTHTTGRVSVKDYGAKGDNSTDDTAAVVAAYNAVKTAGGTIFFPPGIYRFNLTIDVPGIAIIGAGRGSDGATHVYHGGPIGGTTFRPADLTKPVIQIGTGLVKVNAITLRDFTVLGDSTPLDASLGYTAGTATSDGIVQIGAHYVTIIGVDINYMGGDGYRVTSSATQPSFWTDLVSVNVVGCGKVGMHFVYGPSWVTTINVIGGSAWSLGSGASTYAIRTEGVGILSSAFWAETQINGHLAYLDYDATRTIPPLWAGSGTTNLDSGANTDTLMEINTLGSSIPARRITTLFINGLAIDGQVKWTADGVLIPRSTNTKIGPTTILGELGFNDTAFASNDEPTTPVIKLRGSGSPGGEVVESTVGLQLSMSNLYGLRAAEGGRIWRNAASGQVRWKSTTPNNDFDGVPLDQKRLTGTVTGGTAQAISVAAGTWWDLTVNDATAFTINSPINPAGIAGQRITIRVINNTAGAIGAITWGALYKMAAWTNPAAGTSRAIDFQYNGTNWIEASRTPADVPN